MAISYTWDVSTVDTYPSKDGNADVVHNIHYRLTALSSDKDSAGNPFTLTSYGTEDLNTDSISSFKAFGSLAIADVQKWLEDKLGNDRIAAMKTNLDVGIADMVTPKSVQKTIGS
tara:strand:+ start:600 stop:944 length:345 start_codon:yes stop_codon:yes gene_type:complete